MSEIDRNRLEKILRRWLETPQDLPQTKRAEFSLLCDRLLMAPDSSAVDFVRRMADLASKGAMDARRQGFDEIPWVSFEQILRSAADDAHARWS